jgi:hypothetical protein
MHQTMQIDRFCTIDAVTTCLQVGRITITLNDRDHLAFKLLSLQKDEKIVALVQDAMREYLQKEGAYDLSIYSSRQQKGDAS